MIIDDIISGIDEGGPKSYYSFETFVLHLFKHHLEGQKRNFKFLETHYNLEMLLLLMVSTNFKGQL